MSQLRSSTPRARHLFLAAAALICFQPACVQQAALPPSAGAAVAPALSVERFLQASNARDYAAMARLFGTPDGPVSDTGGSLGCAFKRIGGWLGMGDRCVSRQEVEVRMAAMSEVLSHQDFRIVSERPEPGRDYPTNRVGVDITKTGNGGVVRDVPFMVVRNPAGGWYVQEVALERLTQAR
jgi:hypothetical protein